MLSKKEKLFAFIGLCENQKLISFLMEEKGIELKFTPLENLKSVKDELVYKKFKEIPDVKSYEDMFCGYLFDEKCIEYLIKKQFCNVFYKKNKSSKKDKVMSILKFLPNSEAVIQSIESDENSGDITINVTAIKVCRDLLKAKTAEIKNRLNKSGIYANNIKLVYSYKGNTLSEFETFLIDNDFIIKEEM